LRKVSIATDDTIAEVPAKTRVADGCFIELASLRVADDTWWSLCFEALGDVRRLRDVLEKTVRRATRN
jgi:hypothetical protein